MPWSLERLAEELERSEEPFAFLTAMVTSAGQEIWVWAEEGERRSVKRLLGYAMIFFMPEEGVDEALTSLRDILEFSYESPRGMLPPPAVMRRHVGKIVRTSQRPDLVISE
jgi:hypothetical protein